MTADLSNPEGGQIGRVFVALSRVPEIHKLRLLNCGAMRWELFADMRRRAGRKGRWKDGWRRRSKALDRLEELDKRTANENSHLRYL